MYNFTKMIFRIGLIAILLSYSQIVSANNTVDYNSLDLNSLQSQYQNQLKPKAPKKKIVKKAPKRKQINNRELQQYQQLLGQRTQARPKVAPRKTPKVVTKRNVPKPVVRATPARAVPQRPRPDPRQVAVPRPRHDAIFEAASSGNVRLIGQLIQQGINVNQANSARETALHMAAAKGHYSAVIYLLNNGANIHARTNNNWLAIHHATRFRHPQIANYLKQKGSPIHARTSDGMSAIDMARAVNDRRLLGIFGVR